jgi:transporter family-2 protein
MLQQVFTVLIGILGGISVGLQTPIANAMGQQIGSAAGSLIVHVSGAVISGVLVLMRSGENIQDMRQLPWWMFGVGAFGVILFLVIYSKCRTRTAYQPACYPALC